MTFFQENKQNWAIDAWCKKLGINRKTFETHPRIQDIKILLDFDKLDHLMTQKDKEIWQHAWNWVYKKQLPISVYIEKRLLSIVENCKRTEYILKRKQRQAARAISEMKSDHNSEAKGSLSVDNSIYSCQQWRTGPQG